MLIYNSDKPYTLNSALVEFLFSVAIVAAIWLISTYYRHTPSHIEFYFVLPATICFRLFKNLYSKKVHQIVIDTSNKAVVASFKSIFGKEDQKRISFERCKVEFSKTRNWKFKMTERVIKFYDDKEFSFEASKSSGGFSNYSLEDMVIELERLTKEKLN